METNSLVKQALIEIKKLKMERDMPIAIIGMACNFPNKINSPEIFWEALVNKKDCITAIPKERWNIDEHYSSNRAEPGKMYVKEGGFVDNIDQFDLDLFKIPVREAKYMDPQQRLFMEVSWECLERSGINPLSLKGTKTGVYLGICTHDYALKSLYSQQLEKIDIYSFTGSAFSTASGRLSYMLGLEGPSMSIDTACSSSLVALNEACSSIRSRQSEIAIVGGVNLMITPELTVQFCKVNALSPSSRCKTFDASADGYVRSEGCGVVLLKSLDKAIEDNNQILAVIRGVAINNDGVSNSLTAPNGVSQQKLIFDALKCAKLEPNEVSYVEAHGTGTPLGDPIEANAIGNVYCKDRINPLWVGSAKSNLGHLEAAAGMVGLIKTILAIQNKKIPPSLHFENPNPEISWSDYGIKIPSKVEEWPEGKKIAGISAFGFSGTNAHVILEEPPVIAVTDSKLGFPVLTLSAQNEKALNEKIKQTYNYLLQNEESSLDRVCYTSNVCRPQLSHRKAFFFNDIHELKRVMNEYLNQPYHKKQLLNKVVFYIPDEIGMEDSFIRSLYDCNKVFRDILNVCLEELNLASFDDFILRTQKHSRDFIVAYSVISVLVLIGLNPEGITGDGKGWLTVFCVCKMLSLHQCLELLNNYSECHLQDNFFIEIESISLKQPLYLLLDKDGSRLDIGKITDRNFWSITEKDGILNNQKTWLLYIGNTIGEQIDKLKVYCWNLEDKLSFFKTVAFFYENQINILWGCFFEKNQYVPEMLPTTPFIRNRYWIDTPERKVETNIIKSEHGFYIYKLPLYEKKSQCYVYQINASKNRFLRDHGFLGKIVLPATAYIEMMTYASMDIFGHCNFNIKNISYEQALTVSIDQGTELHAYIENYKNGKMQLTLVSHNGISESETQWVKHASATIEDRKDNYCDDIDLDYIRGKNLKSLEIPSYYKHLNEMGYLFGDLHQGITEISVDGEYALAKVILPSILEDELDKYFHHPALLDACSQVFLSLIPEKLSDDSIYITIGTEKFVPYQKAEGELYVVAQVTDIGTSSLKGNIYILNCKHQMVAVNIGYMTKKVNKSTLKQASANSNDYCYKSVWIPKEEQSSVEIYNGKYIIWADHSQFSQDLRNELKKYNSQCIIVFRSETFKILGEFEYEFDPANIEHCSLFKRELQRLSVNGNFNASVYLTSLDYPFSPLNQDIKENVEAICKPLWNIAKELYQNKDSIQNLTVITQNSFNIQFGDYWSNPIATAIWGFIKVMNLEYPGIKCMGIDISEKDSSQSVFVAKEVLRQGKDNLIAFRNGQRYVQRLSRFVAETYENQSVFEETYALRLKAKGSIDYLNYEKVPRIEPADDEVEIEVMVSGFNFHDIIHVLNLMKEESSHFGLDCVGRIARMGKKVQGFEAGDIIIAFAPGCFGKYVTVKSCYVIKKPQNLNVFEAATIPTAYLTAYHIIYNFTSLEKGRSILVHAGSGGLGIALINLAQNIGLTVYATASKNKWFLLKQLGVKHIFDSRTTDYAEQILAITENDGVDMVVNSFTGDHIAKNFSVLKSGGHFVEVGEREKLNREQVEKYRIDVEYSTFSLFDVIKAEPQKANEMLIQLSNLLEKDKIKPIPYQVFDKKYMKDAFRFIQKGRHIGKVLINFSKKTKVANCKKTVVVAGGASGIGWEIIKFWAKNFSDSLVILGRSTETIEICEKLEMLNKDGNDITYYSVDIGDSKALSKVLDEVNEKHPPLKGIIHSAGVINDSLIKNESWENIKKVISSKMFGSWNLHNLTLAKELDFFILFSSVTAVLGSIGVSSYATGNSFMEGFAEYRRQLGLPCLCLNWGPWQDVGMLTRLNTIAREIWTQNGFKTLSSDEGIKILSNLKELDDNISIMPVDWNKWLKQYPNGKTPDLLSDIIDQENIGKRSNYKEDVSQEAYNSNSLSDTLEKVLEDITQIFKRVLQRDISQDEFEKYSFQEIGLDSLMSVEFRNLLNERFKGDFAISLLYSYPDLKSLHKYICDEVLELLPKGTETSTLKIINEFEKQVNNNSENQKKSDKDLTIDDLRKLLDEKINMYF